MPSMPRLVGGRDGWEVIVVVFRVRLERDDFSGGGGGCHLQSEDNIRRRGEEKILFMRLLFSGVRPVSMYQDLSRVGEEQSLSITLLYGSDAGCGWPAPLHVSERTMWTSSK